MKQVLVLEQLKNFKKNSERLSFDYHRLLLLLCVIYTVGIILWLMLFLAYEGSQVIIKEGLNYFITTEWDYGKDQYGILVFIAGTTILTITTMIIAFPLSISTAIFLSEYAPGWFVKIIRPMIELLVGIPSVVYGIFGFFIFEPIFRQVINPFIDNLLGFLPIFKQVSPTGLGILLASAILSIMILPTITVLSEESLRSVPREYREASFALGATKFETLRRLLIPTAVSGITTAFLLGMMRAMGETMAIVMVMGNAQKIPASLLDQGYAMTSKILNDVGEHLMYAEDRSALFGVAVVLFLIEIICIGLTRIIGRKA